MVVVVVVVVWPLKGLGCFNYKKKAVNVGTDARK